MGAAALCAGAVIVPGRSEETAHDGRPHVVATTGILADLASRVAGSDARVISLIPEGGDPHTFEPLPRHIREIAYADLALSNYLMLEEQSLIRTITANLPRKATYLALAEEASTRGATIIPLVENRSLETIWLGLRVSGRAEGADRLAQVRLAMTSMNGPGNFSGYVTGTFGQPEQVFQAADGVSARTDATDLPMDAHTHMSWAMTKPGLYKVGFRGTWRGGAIGEQAGVDGELWVAAGALPPSAERAGREVIDTGHADLTVDVAARRLVLRVDVPGEQASPGQPAPGRPASGVATRDIPLDKALVYVPPKALMPVPSDPAFRFIAPPGTDVYQLPQAVLGKHVHGEIDPHLWHDVTNAQAYVEVIRDHLMALDPKHGSGYAARAASYLKELDAVDAYMRASITSIPKRSRNLVTTHDAYGYLAARYGLTIAGVVSPSPGAEPSLADRRRLSQTLRDLHVPAVFLEATAPPTSRSLVDAAHEAGVKVLPIWGDSFTPEVRTYADMVRANADSLARGLGGSPQGAHDRAPHRQGLT